MSRLIARCFQALVILSLGVSLAAPAAPAGTAASSALASRTFKLSYRDVRDVVALIQPMISQRGSYAVEPASRSVTVSDTTDVIERIQDLIASYDLPPRGIDLVVQLMRAEEGSRDPEAQESRSRRIGLPPAVIRDLTKWGVITPIGSAAVSTAENETGTVAMGDEYRLRFSVGAVAATVGVIRVERFVLERMRAPAASDQAKEAPPWTPLMDLVLNLKDRQTTVLGATSSQDSRQALFVSVTASIVEP